jgi:hypothetical protein
MKSDKKTNGTGKKTDPIEKKDVPNHPDAKIDEDFPGFPHPPADEKIIKPKTQKDRKTADLDNKDGEKINYDDRSEDDGSANAFERTEYPEE